MGAPMGNDNAKGPHRGMKGKGAFLKNRRVKSKISKLDSKKSLLLRQVNKLVALKKRSYPHPDITSPMSLKEKKLDKMISKRFSDINEIVRQKRGL